MNLFWQGVRYLTVGVLNTAVGLGIIYILMFAGVPDLSANFVGYAVGFGISFWVNSHWTFKEGPSRARALRYAVVVCVGYALNICLFLYSRDVLGINSYLAQFLGVCAYTVVGFVGSRLYVFGPNSHAK